MRDFDFDTPVERRGTNSYKWDSAEPGVIPMWVADMDFRTAPCVTEALERRARHGIFGYVRVPQAYYDATTDWFASRHGWTINQSHIIYTSGVVPALSAIIKALCPADSKVMVTTPVYNCFFSSIRNNGCIVADAPLELDGSRYCINWDKLESTAADPDVKLMLLCNPHNPAGRVWMRKELERLRDVCRRHNVVVVSDEIHCELTFPGVDYVPYATVDPRAIVCCSPSKAFNIAGLQIANIVCPDAERREAIDRAININEVCDVGVFGVEALIAAYRGGAQWLDALREYIFANYLTLREYFTKHLPELPVVEMEGTYLAWVDCRALGLGSEELEERLIDTVKLWLNCGAMYGTDGFMRINMACPRSVLLEGLNRLRQFVREENAR